MKDAINYEEFSKVDIRVGALPIFLARWLDHLSSRCQKLERVN